MSGSGLVFAARTRRPTAWDWLRSSPRVVPAILLLALLLRLALIAAFPIEPASDSQWYLLRGRELAQGLGYQENGLPTAFWPVGYPALLGLACAIFGPSMVGPVLFNLVAQLATVLLILWFARTLTGNEGTARLAALLYAVYPSHIVYTGDTAAEITSTAVTMAGTALLLKARGGVRLSLAAGLVLGLATLMRTQILLFPPVVLALMAATLPGIGWRRLVRSGIFAAAGMALVILPWTARNKAVLHAPVLVSTNGGVALQAGANRLADGGYFQVEKSPLWAEVGIPFDQRVARQVEIDARLKHMALGWIAQHPGEWFLLGFRKVWLLWSKDTDGFWSLDESYPGLSHAWMAGQLASQAYYLAILALGLAGFATASRAALRREPPAPLLIAAAMPAFCTVLAFGFTGQTRYHFLAMPFLMIAAAWTLTRRLDRRSGLAA